MSDTPRLLTMTAEQWGDMLQFRGRPDAIRHLKAEVLAQAARVRELEQALANRDPIDYAEEYSGGVESRRQLQARIATLEQERERIRQALEKLERFNCDCLNYQCDDPAKRPTDNYDDDTVALERWIVLAEDVERVLTSLPPAGEREAT